MDRAHRPSSHSASSTPPPGSRHGVGSPVLGVDGGQTGTRAVLVERDGRVLRRAEAGPMVHALEPGGRERLVEVLTAIRDATRIEAGDPAVVFLGLTAVIVGTGAEPVGGEVAEALWPASERVVENDAIVAWAGATAGLPGVAAMAGTGSVVYGVNERGESVRTGGWSYLFGDPGGGWHIGNTTVRRMLLRWDRDQAVSPLGQAVLDELGASGPPDVADRAYAGEFDLVRVARLAEVVARTAAEGDREARGILADCAAEFAVDVAAAIGRIGWEREPVLVATVGRAFRAGPGYRASFLAALERLSPRRVRLTDPVLSGLGGAALLALGRAGVPPSPALVERLLAEGLGPDEA